jgi:hypothetical protein
MKSEDKSWSRRINTVIDMHRKHLIPAGPNRERYASDETYEEAKKAYENKFADIERELDILRSRLRSDQDAIDPEDADYQKEQIENKLAVSSIEIAHPDDWQWTGVSPAHQSLLRDVHAVLQKESTSKSQRWKRILFYVWHGLGQLCYLAIVLGLFYIASSKFETVIYSVLVLIYNAATLSHRTTILGTVAVLGQTEAAHVDLARALRFRVPLSDLKEAVEETKKSIALNKIHALGLGLGSLIALAHLVVTIFSEVNKS